MTSIGTNLFNVSSFQKIGFEVSAKKMTDEEIARLKKTQNQAFSLPTNLDEFKNHVSQRLYAEVVVNGKIVAKLYNSGSAETANASYSKIANLPSMGESEVSTGPELAQKRAEEIAKALGGVVIPAPTAATQAQYLAAPAFKPEYATTADGIEKEKRKVEGRVVTPQTQVDSQILAEETSPTAADKAIADFLDFTGKSWEEKMRAMILQSLGLKEEDLANMTPEELAKIEEKIKEKIKQDVEKETGIPATQA